MTACKLLPRLLPPCVMLAALGTSAAEPPEPAVAGPPAAETYRRLAEQMERHWKGQLLPKWFPASIDRERGGFYSHFREDWTRGERNDKTIVYQARMTWVAAQVALRYPELREGYLQYTRHGVDFLAATLWDEKHGGFYWGLEPEGDAPIRGGEKHAYGISFGLYGAAAAYEATGDEKALDLAKRTFLWLEEHARDREHGGYYEAYARNGTRLLAPPSGSASGMDLLGTQYGFKSMNSHIHLLEALTALRRVWPDEAVEGRLREMLGVVRDKVAVEPGCLNLYFTPDWRAVPDHDSFGHDIETTFLLLEAAETLGQTDDAKTLRVAWSLTDHALAWGWDGKHGGFYDKGAAFRPAWDREKVWWTQAEGLNALLAMHEAHGKKTPRYWEALLKQWAFVWNHQIDHRRGGWCAAVSAEGHAEPGRAKASPWKAAYHNGRALMHCAERLRKLAQRGLEAR